MTTKKQKAAAIIVAAGEGKRMGGIDKVFTLIGGESVLVRSTRPFQQCKLIDQIVVVVSGENEKKCRRLIAGEEWSKVSDVCVGGKRRQDSVAAGLELLRYCDWVVIHDGARPLVTVDLIERGLQAARETGAAVAAVDVKDTIKLVDDNGTVSQTLSRQNLRAVQTPQVFRVDLLQLAHRQHYRNVTDDAAMVEKMGHKVKLYQGSYDNIKITTPEDLILAEELIKRNEK
ncbi:MAG: 2-C-methyl-D-erythritol 4-phosphate cytidylyltransferase [Dehalococcoidia bacterium]|jgi:2-C-methyl-D-erythritol 4-phosphate cytidylyltransferase